MASIIAYVGDLPEELYKEGTPGIPPSVWHWDRGMSFRENLTKFSVEDQVRCCLDQALALAYYMTFYGNRCHEVVNEFIQEFCCDVNYRLAPQAKREFKEGLRLTLVDDLIKIVKFLKVHQWEDVHIGLIQEFLENAPYDAMPRAWRRVPNYIPFLIWKNMRVDKDFPTFTHKELGLLSFHLDAFGPFWPLYTENYFIGTSFSADETPIDEASRNIAILPYLSHFNLANIPFETLIGGIGSMCFHYDVRRSGTSTTQILAAAIRSKTMGLATLSGCTLGYDTDVDWLKHGYFQHLKTFLKFANQKYGMVAKSKEVLSRLFSCIAENKEQKDSASYIRDQGGSASADHLAAYERLLGGLEALQLISQSPTLLSAQSQVADSAESKNGPDKKDDAESKPAEPETKEEPKSNEAEEGDTTQDELDEDDTSAKDDGEDAGGSAEGSGDPDDTGDPSTDDSQTDSPGGDIGAEADDMPAEVETINTSDDEGIVFKIANPDDETTDSVMFREEMNNFLGSILANPPEDMSPQNVATITCLRRFWLYTLSIETIMGIVGSCGLQLPDSLTKLNTQCTE